MPCASGATRGEHSREENNMISNGKALGLVTLAVLVACSVSAPAASAEATADEFTAQKYPATIHGTDAKGVTTFVTEAGSLECAHSIEGKLEAPSQTLTVFPTWSTCTMFGFFAATVETDGCGYLYHITTRLIPDVYQAHMDIECPSGKAITVTSFTCKFQIPAQNNLTTVDFENMTNAFPSDITMTDTVKPVRYVVTQDGLGCPFNGTGEKNNGEFVSHAPMTLTGNAGNGIVID
jgi:hypothetical protein